MKSVARLFDQFMPKHYDLHLTIDRLGRKFSGEVTIHGVSSRLNYVSLHAKNLTIKHAYVDEIETTVSLGEFDELKLDTKLTEGSHKILISFTGTITNSMHGLYPGYYTHEGVAKELLATQFESHHAREVFPCIDEPEAKATFDLTLETEKDVSVLSNTPLKHRSYTDTTTISTFETTPRMSTYLLAFVIGDLHRQHATTTSGVEVSVYATKSQPVESLEFALDIAMRGIDFFEEYFGVAYPLAKCDHVAIPDFSAGAMENWGLIIYRERALLAPTTASQTTKEYIATVICHELSHQWFGNLVTMKWWNDLWLNESFANLMEYVAVDALEPSWNIWQTYVSQESTMALSRDYLAGVQPVKVIVRHPDEISSLFDPAIVYAKGGKLLRMVKLYVGEKAFRAGLRDYFHTYAYSNTESDDLWRSIASHSNIDIEYMMDSWLDQSGFPVVQVETTDKGYTLKQRRLVVGQKHDEQLWRVPLFASQDDFPDTLTSRNHSFTAAHSFPYINKNVAGHFIAHYDDIAFEQVLDGLKAGALTPTEMLMFLFETILLAKANAAKSTEYIKLIALIAHNDSEALWTIIAHGVSELRRFVEHSDDEELLDQFVCHITDFHYQKLGHKEKSRESDEHKKLRALICGLRLNAHDQTTRKDMATLVPTKLSILKGELRPIVYRYIAIYGSKTEFNALLVLHNTTNDALLRADALDGLTYTQDIGRIQELLDQLTNTKIVKPQDTVRWYVGLMRNTYARTFAWHWMQHNWKFIMRTFDGDKMYEAFAKYSASSLNTSDEYNQYEVFFGRLRDDIAIERSITIGMHELKNRVAVIAKQRSSVIEALRTIMAEG